MEDLEQIFLRSWRESHLTETRQPQQAPPQPCPPAPGAVAQVTSAQLPWLAGLAASSCNDSVHIIECTHSLAEGLSEMFRLLVEGKLAKTNYVVIICACRSSAIDSCIAVTGEAPPHPHPPPCPWLGLRHLLCRFPSRPPLQFRPFCLWWPGICPSCWVVTTASVRWLSWCLPLMPWSPSVDGPPARKEDSPHAAPRDTTGLENLGPRAPGHVIGLLVTLALDFFTSLMEIKTVPLLCRVSQLTDSFFKKLVERPTLCSFSREPGTQEESPRLRVAGAPNPAQNLAGGRAKGWGDAVEGSDFYGRSGEPFSWGVFKPGT